LRKPGGRPQRGTGDWSATASVAASVIQARTPRSAPGKFIEYGRDRIVGQILEIEFLNQADVASVQAALDDPTRKTRAQPPDNLKGT